MALLGLRIRRYEGAEAVGRPLLDVGIASCAGLGLAAPLILPALQVSSGSVRAAGRHNAFPLSDMLHAVFQTFNGTSLAGSRSFDAHGLGWVSTADYVGVIAVVFAAVALITVRRRPALVAFAVVVVVAGCLVYLAPLVSFLNKLPGIDEVRWVRSIQVLGFGVAILAGAGLDALARSHGGRKVRNWMGAGFGAAAVLLLLVWAFGRGQLPPLDATIRSRSFVWPAAEAVLGLVVFGILVLMRNRGPTGGGSGSWPRLLGDPSRVAAMFLTVSSTAFLVAVGASWWSSNTTYLAPTPAVTALQQAVGTSIVGFGTSSCLLPPTLGIQANVNIVYGVHELDAYDPLTPQLLYTAWTDSTGRYPLPIGPSGIPEAEITQFCPVVSTTAAARLFGVEYVLEPDGANGPPGSVFDKKIGDEELYRIPGASAATISPLDHGSLPPVTAPGQPLAVAYPDAASWKVVTHATTPQVLRLRLTDVPGWHASMDGKPLPLIRFNRIMLQAKIPPGRHTIELHYWPDAFNAGIVVAGGTAVVLAVALVFGGRWGRRRRAGGTRTGSAAIQ